MFKYWSFLEWFHTRLVCLLHGCEEHYESSWNMPDDWHSPVYCPRCGACFDIYGIETTPFEHIESSESIIGRLQWWSETNCYWLYCLLDK